MLREEVLTVFREILKNIRLRDLLDNLELIERRVEQKLGEKYRDYFLAVVKTRILEDVFEGVEAFRRIPFEGKIFAEHKDRVEILVGHRTIELTYEELENIDRFVSAFAFNKKFYLDEFSPRVSRDKALAYLIYMSEKKLIECFKNDKNEIECFKFSKFKR